MTGLRNPCAKINDFRPGLLAEVFAPHPASGEFTFKSGVMGVVRSGGLVRPGDPVVAEQLAGAHRPLERVQGVPARSSARLPPLPVAA